MHRWLFPRHPYDCLQCGKSCGGWRVLVDEEARQRLDLHPLVEEVRRAGFEPMLQGPDGLWRLGEAASGKCHFLRPDNLCALHAESGYAMKPRACRQFPFFLVETPAGMQVGLSFRCTAVQQNHGRAVSAHQEDLEALAATGRYPRRGFGAIPMTLECVGDWELYLCLERFVLEQLEEGELRSRLWSLSGGVARAPMGPFCLAPPGALTADLEGLLAASLVGYLETDRPDEMHPITQALCLGLPYVSRRLGREIDPAALPPAQEASWLEEEARRYLLHLVERKYLLEGPTVLGRLVSLGVIWPVLIYYTRLHAWLANEALDRHHYYRAVEIVEGEAVAHVQPLESFFVGFEESFLRILA